MPAEHETREQNRIAFRQLWDGLGSLGRLPFIFWGILFGVIKYNLDRLIAGLVFERSWLFWNYFEPSSEYPLRNLPPGAIP
jgi:hypothetical protein